MASPSLGLAESLEWALESRSSSLRVIARTTLTLDAWSMSLRGPRPAPVASDLSKLPPVRALMASSLALVTVGTVAVVDHYPLESSPAVIRLAPAHVVLAEPPPAPPTTTTTAPPTTAPPPTTTTTSTVLRPKAQPVQSNLTAAAGGVWAALRQCESGGNYRENTGNGFYGAYQFTQDTWSGLGYAGRPDQAPPAMQDEAAQKLQARSGWGQWPACSRKLGLT